MKCAHAHYHNVIMLIGSGGKTSGGAEGLCPCYGPKALAEAKGLKDRISLGVFFFLFLSHAVISVKPYEDFFF